MNADLVKVEWDVIVIGAGLGGGVIGRRLAEKGLKVLFVEQGPLGWRAEQQNIRDDVFDPVARRVRGYETRQLKTTIDGRVSRSFSLLGAGVGGSSAFYAATLERPERHDIDDGEARPHPTGGWPIAYEDFAPYFSQAEQMFHVCGEADPLSDESASELAPPPALDARDQGLKASFEASGLHPYHVHLGVRFLPGCELCLGRKCPKACKMDGRSAGVEPALETGNAAVLDMCEVRAIRGHGRQISHLEVHHEGQSVELLAKQYVLAGGALGSPRLLLASASEDWPDGCGNGSGLVGRNLMFHLTEFLAIWPKTGDGSAGPTKTISLRDFYHRDGQRFGTLADMGIDASYGEILHFLNNRYERSFLQGLPGLRQFLRVPAFIGSRVLGRAKIFAGLIEDLPRADNRVLLDRDDPEQISIEYSIDDDLKQRRKAYRRLIRRSVKGLRSLFINFEPDLNFPHCCGSLRFGTDPRTSVFDENCKAHEVDNLYLADASFMPTSTGINPGLTVIANALRVGDVVAKRFSR